MAVKAKLPSEHAEQVAFVNRIRWMHSAVIVAAVPNGLPITALQRVRAVSEGLTKGMPDLLILEPKNGFHGLCIEMKRAKPAVSVVSKEQKDMLERLNAKGYVAKVAYGAEEAYKIFLEYIK